MSEIKLKPCPFCGGKAESFQDYMGWFVVQCKCGIGTLHYSTLEAAVKAWNRRTPNDR